MWFIIGLAWLIWGVVESWMILSYFIPCSPTDGLQNIFSNEDIFANYYCFVDRLLTSKSLIDRSINNVWN